MKTTIESYQNMTESQRDLKIAKLNAILEKALLLELNEKITSERLKNIFKLFMNKITFLYSLPIEIEVTPITEMNTLNKLILVTPTTTQNKSNIERIKTQINQTIKKRTRNNITFEYALFLHTVRKITTKKFLSIANKKRVKTDTLRRVHTLLVYEHNRLNKVA
jgi:hypothetical protein